MIKILIGGSPCTYWSIAQKNNRETEPSGQGWELFKNYLIAKDKFKPDFFLYENNKSAAKSIKDQIKQELCVDNTNNHYIEINSALVSAQNRKRFYVHNCGKVGQPEDRDILLRDILENGQDLTSHNKAFTLTASYSGAVPYNTIERHQKNMVATPIYVGEIPHHKGIYRNNKQASQQYRVHSVEGKSVCCDADSRHYIANPVIFQTPHGFNNGGCKYDKSPTITANGSWADNNHIITPIKVGALSRPNGGGLGGKTGLYAMIFDNIGNAQVYCVNDGLITIKGKQYPIKLVDGYYIIRKLTVTECCRLQTMPDDYCRAVSNSQAYKGLGNGWTAEVIIHILKGALKDVPKDEEIVVLSMYDGIGTGRYCLDKMGFTNIKYYAFEVDKYAKQIAMSNYPDIIQLGDAFQIREEKFKLKGELEMNDKTKQLLELVEQNPNLPILPMVYSEVVGREDYSSWCGTWGHSEVNEYCVFSMRNETHLFTRSEQDEIEKYIADEMCNDKELAELSDEEFNKLVHERAESLVWTKAIIVYIIA